MSQSNIDHASSRAEVKIDKVDININPVLEELQKLRMALAGLTPEIKITNPEHQNHVNVEIPTINIPPLPMPKIVVNYDKIVLWPLYLSSGIGVLAIIIDTILEHWGKV